MNERATNPAKVFGPFRSLFCCRMYVMAMNADPFRSRPPPPRTKQSVLLLLYY